MTVHVWWLTRHAHISSHGPWDTRILDDLFSGKLWPHDWEFQHHHNVDTITRVDERAVVVLPARHHASDTDVAWLNGELAKLPACILFLAGDEEGLFPWKKVIHDNCRFWIQHPHPVAHREMLDWTVGLRFYGCGSPIDFGGVAQPTKTRMWSFIGQNTHPGRQQAVDGLARARAKVPGVLEPTSGFMQGRAQWSYAEILAATRVAPCPAGPATPDTFRFYEALEAGCYPIVDAHAPGVEPGYWEMVYGKNFPFPQLEDWNTVGGWIETSLVGWPWAGIEASTWWMGQKRDMVIDLDADLRGINIDPPETPWWHKMTALITTSPVPSNPSTEMIETTLQSMRASAHEDIPVVIACDGVRPEQADMAAAYADYVETLCWKAQHDPAWRNVLVLAAQEHLHQIRLTRWALDEITTPLLLFMEHDTPFYADAPIDWAKAVDVMEFGVLDALRFHHESSIPAPHRRLLIDQDPTVVYGLPVQRIRQWSQRPHLSPVDYYRRMLKWIDRRPNNGFIEDEQYSIAVHDPTHHRVALYAPPGSMLRTYHLDGRAGGPKYDGELLPR